MGRRVRAVGGIGATLAIVATALLGCADGDEPALAGPGTPIADGFEVAAGTKLVGRALPDIQRTSYDEPPGDAWVALLAVDGDPAEAFDAYVTQAGDLGVPMRSADPRTACTSAWDSSPLIDARDIDDIDPRGRDLPITCAVYGTGVPWDVEIAMATTGPGADARWAGSIVLRVRNRGSTAGAVQNDEALLGGFGAALPPPGDAPPPPTTGERLAPGDERVIQDLRVPDGTAAMAVAATSPYYGSWTTVLHTERDPETLLTELLRSNPGADSAPVEQSTIDGEQVWWGWWDQAGGDKLYVSAVADGDGGWYILVDAATDP